MKSILTFLALSLAGASLFSSCSKENAYQDDANQQNTLVSQQKTQQLNQVIGTYTGQMYLTEYSDQPLDVQIYLGVSQGTASEPDQINKLQVPTLGGNLVFPAIQKQGSFGAVGSFGDIVRAMGGQQIRFINGDFNTNNSMITLPYNSGSTTQSGDQVIGTFSNGVFSGEWDSSTLGKMGTFSVERSGS